jgi:flagellar motility protein MotE (MotC chaperone)
MNKKMIILTALAGLLSFAVCFAVSLLFPGGAENAEIAGTQDANAAVGISTTAESQSASESELPPPQVNDSGGMAEKQLKGLVYDLRQKMTEYDEKLKSLEAEKQRLEIARGQLEQDIEKLDALRADLAGSISQVKTERDRLLKTRIEIGEIEKKNLTAIAASYDKMDSTSAGKILANMTQEQNGGMNDAVKILYYMGDRNKAKVLASLADIEPSLAANLSQKLKTLTEVQ